MEELQLMSKRKSECTTNKIEVKEPREGAVDLYRPKAVATGNTVPSARDKKRECQAACVEIAQNHYHYVCSKHLQWVLYDTTIAILHLLCSIPLPPLLSPPPFPSHHPHPLLYRHVAILLR